MNDSNFDRRASAYLVGATACWGIAVVITKHLLASIPPFTLLAIQLITSVGFLWPLVFFNRKQLLQKPLPSKEKWMRIGWLGVLNPGISYTLSLMGLATTTASMSTLLWASEPVLILLLAWWLLREKLTLSFLVLSLVTISGVVMISGLLTESWAAGSLTGNFLILSGVLCCALYTALTRRAGVEMDPLLTISIQQTFALVWALMLLPLEWKSTTWMNLRELGLQSWMWIGISGALYYALAFWFYLQGLARVRASLAGVFINLIPIFGIGGAYLFLGERLTPFQWLGVAIILTSVFAIFHFENRREHIEHPLEPAR